MLEAAEGLEFEKAAALRDQVRKLREGDPGRKVRRTELEEDGERPAGAPGSPGSRARRKKKSRRPAR